MKMITYSAALKYRIEDNEAANLSVEKMAKEILDQLPLALTEEELINQLIEQDQKQEMYCIGSEFHDCASTEEIAARMEEIILEEFEGKLDQFGKARLSYLSCAYTEEDWDFLYRGYIEGTLINHLLQVQEDCKEWVMEQEPKMKKSWGMTPQMQVEEPKKWVGLYNNLLHELWQMAKDIFCYI